MVTTYSVPLKKLVEEFDLQPVFLSSDYDKVRVAVDDVSRPGLQIAGFFDHFEPMRLQVLGTVESTYLHKLSSEERSAVFERFFAYRSPALIVARNLDIVPECLEMAMRYDVSILRSADTTSSLVSSMIAMLRQELAPRVTRHGVLVDVYGEGILLYGESGIGKSESAIELVKRGHRLIADDAVEIRKVTDSRLNGSAPEMIRHYIELRGIGVINVAKLFGVGAVRHDADIDLLINIVPWTEGANYDRLGLESQYTDILGVKVPTITVPVTPGRNMAVIIEVAAMNNRQKKMGYNAAEEFAEQLNRHFDTEAARNR
ncbi:MAG: HPr(Ser) kinase/phosphatase [Oscillospiraceae bacterium]|nr:HPr(Ser) kinase/phosphatase [Oscillospiraceae bacterium]